MSSVGNARHGPLRASDLDRAQTVERLSEALSVGRLTLEEFDERMAEALAARTLADLAGLVSDLPEPIDMAHLRDLADDLLVAAAELGVSRAELLALLSRDDTATSTAT